MSNYRNKIALAVAEKPSVAKAIAELLAGQKCSKVSKPSPLLIDSFLILHSTWDGRSIIRSLSLTIMLATTKLSLE